MDLRGFLLGLWRSKVGRQLGLQHGKGWIGRLLSQSEALPPWRAAVWAGVTSHREAQRSHKCQRPVTKEYVHMKY